MNPYTVLRDFDLPHCEEGAHEAIDADPSDPRYDATKSGTQTHGIPVEEHISLGMVACAHRPTRYVAGQTVHLSDTQAAELVAAKVVAPAGSHVEFELVPHVYVEVK